MGGKSASHAGLYGVDLEPDPRYKSCCSNIFRPGRVLRDCCLGLLVLFVIAAVIGAMFLLVFFVLKDLTPSAAETGPPSNASHSGLDGPGLPQETRGRAGRREEEININDIYSDDDHDWDHKPDIGDDDDDDDDDDPIEELEPEPTPELEPEPSAEPGLEPGAGLDSEELESDTHPVWEEELQLFTTDSTAAVQPEPELSTTAEPEPEPTTAAESEQEPTTTAEPEPEPTTASEPEQEPTTTAEPEPEPSTTAATEQELPASEEQTPGEVTTEAPQPTDAGDVIRELYEIFGEIETELSATDEPSVEPVSEQATTVTPQESTTPESSVTPTLASPSSVGESEAPTTEADEPAVVEARGFDVAGEREPTSAPADPVAPTEAAELTTVTPTAGGPAPSPTAGEAVDTSTDSQPPVVVEGAEASEPTPAVPAATTPAPTAAADEAIIATDAVIDAADASQTTQIPAVVIGEGTSSTTEKSAQSPAGGLSVVAGPDLATERPGPGDSGDTFNIVVSDTAADGADIGGDEIVTSAALPEWAMTTASPPVVPEGATETADSEEEPGTAFGGTTLTSLLSGGALAALAKDDVIDLMEKKPAPEGRSLDSGPLLQVLGGGAEKDTIDSCPEDAFSCEDGACVPNAARCDGAVDCRDGRDEAFCPVEQCVTGQYRCAGQTVICLSSVRRCDGAVDCPVGDDEQGCAAAAAAADATEPIEGGRPVPEAEEPAPTVVTSAPAAAETVPAIEEATPETEAATTTTEAAAPIAEAAAPTTTEAAAPVAEAAAPTTTEAAAPTAEAATPTTTEAAAPIAEAAAPTTTEEAAPIAEAAGPTTAETAAPTAEAAAPTTTEAAAPTTTEAAAPATEASAPTTTEEAAPIAEAAAPTTTEAAAPIAEAAAPTAEGSAPSTEAAPVTEAPALVVEEVTPATEELCPLGELRCLGGLCISLEQVCDGVAQCPDGADELNCRE